VRGKRIGKSASEWRSWEGRIGDKREEVWRKVKGMGARRRKL